MVTPQEENLVYDVKISSVGPGHSSGSDIIHSPSGLDLAMKLHYLRVVYFFESEAAQGLTVKKIKESLFTWLDYSFITCGRFRRSETGRPYVKCNDCGARFIEAKCKKTLDEWLAMKDWPSQKLLVSQQVIGPELMFSPPLLFQITYFKCGGLSVGLSWAHVLGDPFSASNFMKSWGHVISSLRLNKPYNIPSPNPIAQEFHNQSPTKIDPISAKRVKPVGDHWILANNCKMGTFSFHLSSSQLNHLKAKIWGQSIEQNPTFESLCAIIWNCIAQVRGRSEPEIVTICKKDPFHSGNDFMGNKQLITKVEADFDFDETDLRNLAKTLQAKAVDERKKIEEEVEKDQGVNDFFVYGANLTFIDLDGADLYGLEVRGHRPKFVYHSIQGVGDGGVVMVLPLPEGSINSSDGGHSSRNGGGKFVTVFLPENQLNKLKFELKKKGLLLEDELE